MKHAAYLEAVEAYFQGDNRKLEKFVNDGQNGQCEISVIRARQLIKKGKYKLAQQLLQALTPTSDLMRAEIAILRASLYSFASDWQNAIGEAMTALENYQNVKLDRGIFISNYNLSVYFNRLGLDGVSNRYLSQAKQWMKTPTQKALVYRAEACASLRRCEYRLAIDEVAQALALKNEIDPVDAASLMTVAADIHFRAGEVNQALAFLEEVSQSKVHRDKARIRFELTILRSMTENNKVLVPSLCPEVIEQNREYFLYWKILDYIQSGDASGADNLWNELAKEFPQRFTANYNVISSADEKSIFIVALRRLISQPVNTAIELPDLTGKPFQLLNILRSSRTPLRREELIEKLWNISYDPAYDNRFYKLMGRLKKTPGVKIEVILNTYRMVI